MNTKDPHTKLSKFLSLVLRHKPETIEMTLSEHGWVATETLLQKMNQHGVEINLETLRLIVATSDKKRFAFNEDKSQIRANQGHSVKVDLGYTQKTPPHKLYHGTAQRHIESIFKTGLEKRDRHHVHLSREIETAMKVGQRHGKPVLLVVDAAQMHKDGFEFYESDNQVWLTDKVPVEYLALDGTRD